MFIVLVHGWQQQESDVTDIVADVMNATVYEIRQKIAGGGPTVLTSFANLKEAEALSSKLVQAGVPSFVVDRGEVRSQARPFPVSRFTFNEKSLSLESINKEQLELDYDTLTLILIATYLLEQEQEVKPKKRRKFSFRRRKKEKTVIIPERDETLWLYAQGEVTIRFDRMTLNFDGLGAALQLTRELNFNYLKSELRSRSESATYDDRLIRRSGLVNLLGPTLNPDNDLDLAFEVLSRSLSVTEDPDQEKSS